MDSQAKTDLAYKKFDLDADKLTLGQLREADAQLKTINTVAFERAKLAASVNEKLSSAIAIKRINDLDPTHKDFEKQRAQILLEHYDAFGDPLLKQTLENRDILNRQHVAAQDNWSNEREKEAAHAELAKQKENAPSKIFDESDKTLVTLGKLKDQYKANGQPVPQHVTDALYNMGQVLKDASFQAMQRSQTAAAPVVTPAASPAASAPAITPAPTVAPAPSPTPSATPVAAPSATASTTDPAARSAAALNLLKNALASPTPSATPLATASSSGLPDDSEKRLDEAAV